VRVDFCIEGFAEGDDVPPAMVPVALLRIVVAAEGKAIEEVETRPFDYLLYVWLLVRPEKQGGPEV